MKHLTPLVLASIAVALGLLAFLGNYSHHRWEEQYYFGEVREVRADTLVIAVGRHGDEVVRILPETTIRKGRAPIQTVFSEGERVMVLGKKMPDGTIAASVISITGPAPRQP